MTTTRISHIGHDHPSTTAARTACRKAMKAATPAVTMVRTAKVGKGKAVHVLAGIGTHSGTTGLVGDYAYTRCGIDSRVTSTGDAPLDAITCKSCIAAYGHANR